MDQAVLTAAVQTILGTGIVGLVISALQERILGDHIEGRSAFLFNVAVSLGVGIIAVYSVGGFHLGAPPTDFWTGVAEVLKVVAGIVAASKIAFELVTRPIAMR